MNWTTISPGLPGFYWYKEPGSDPEVVRVILGSSGLIMCKTGTDEDYELNAKEPWGPPKDTMYAGPIPEPGLEVAPWE